MLIIGLRSERRKRKSLNEFPRQSFFEILKSDLQPMKIRIMIDNFILIPNFLFIPDSNKNSLSSIENKEILLS